MPFFLSDQHLSFRVTPPATNPSNLKDIIIREFNATIDSYGLSGDERIFNPWTVEVIPNSIDLYIPDSDELDVKGDIDVVPSLLIFLKIFENIGDILPVDRQLYYLQRDIGYDGILTIPTGFSNHVVLTNIYDDSSIRRTTFDIMDLDYRDFMVESTLSATNEEKLTSWLNDRWEYIPPISELMPVTRPSLESPSSITI